MSIGKISPNLVLFGNIHLVPEQLAVNKTTNSATVRKIWRYLAKYWCYLQDLVRKLAFNITDPKVQALCQIKSKKKKKKTHNLRLFTKFWQNFSKNLDFKI